MPSTTLAVVAAVASIAGAGISAYGQYQSGKAQNAIAQFKAMQQEKQAQTQLLSMQTQAALQKQQAEANFKLRSAEAQARLNNAQALEDQALSQDAINRANLRKRREDFARMQGEQRAAIAASGVAEATGTPLDLLAETAAKIQQDQEEQHYAGELQRRTLFSEAEQERLGGKLALAGATLDRDSLVAEAALREAGGQASFLAGKREAEIMRLTGSAAQKASTYQAAGTLLSGIGSAADVYGRSMTKAPKKPTSGTSTTTIS
jgi:hypothetical protein